MGCAAKGHGSAHTFRHLAGVHAASGGAAEKTVALQPRRYPDHTALGREDAADGGPTSALGREPSPRCRKDGSHGVGFSRDPVSCGAFARGLGTATVVATPRCMDHRHHAYRAPGLGVPGGIRNHGDGRDQRRDHRFFRCDPFARREPAGHRSAGASMAARIQYRGIGARRGSGSKLGLGHWHPAGSGFRFRRPGDSVPVPAAAQVYGTANSHRVRPPCRRGNLRGWYPELRARRESQCGIGDVPGARARNRLRVVPHRTGQR